MTRSSVTRLLITFVCLALLGAAAGAEVYTVTLHNGNSFLSKYKPADAPFDPNYVILMTNVGNTIALAKEEIADVVSETESRGFGVVINTTTVLIGELPNDNPTEEQAMEAMEQRRATPSFGGGGGAINSQQFGEPTTAGSGASGGLPVGFATGFVRVPQN